MPDDAIKPALRAALRNHEIGNKSPYQLFFAAKGNSGASFGFMQGDLATQQPFVHDTFRKCLGDAGCTPGEIANFDQRLSVHLQHSPLTAQEQQRVNDALLADKALVDAMDERILQGVYGHLDQCNAKAAQNGRTIEPEAQLYVAMWINMTGPPSSILTWLSGGDPHLPGGAAPPLGATVTKAAIQGYLRKTKYYTQNPGNFPHLVESADAGAALLP